MGAPVAPSFEARRCLFSWRPIPEANPDNETTMPEFVFTDRSQKSYTASADSVAA